ncbi:hypothetical protein GCM10022406_26030 [Hymenobacter algoricola]|uniref:AB hydrolase-1 domain-containing protein n=1 Tax=Hymenobacter algoricola TaxID=486267 RepID=A0ABP7NA02_9BACT
MFSFFLLLQSPVAAQSLLLEGQVRDQVSQAPVPFATLGIQQQPLGSVADAQGRFHFRVPTTLLASGAVQLVVSCVGFTPAAVPVAAFRAGPQTVQLRAAAVELGDVTVRPGNVTTKTFGRTGASAFMVARMYTEPALEQDELGKEQGTILDLDPDCRLRELRFHVAFNRFQRVRFRLNLYAVQAGRPAAPVPHPDILFEVTQPRGWVSVDLTPYRILLQNHRQVAVTLQWLQSEAAPGTPKAFGLSAVPTPGHAILFRDKSQAPWREVRPGHLSLFLTADSYRGAAPRRSAPTPATYAVPDSLKYLQFVEHPQPAPPDSHHYGDSAAAGHYVPVRGARLYYEEYGQGAPLLLLHGNGQSVAAFERQLAPLARHFRVIAVDTRAQGKSRDFTTGPLSYDLFAADAWQLLQALHLERASVLGWSDGANTALQLALAHPAAVDRLVLMAPNLFPTEQALAPGVLAGLREQLLSLPARPDTSARQQARLVQLLLEEPRLSFTELAAITAPTLVLAGQYDLIRETHTRAIARHIRGARLAIFPGASHNAPQEIPALFNQTVLDFLLTP